MGDDGWKKMPAIMSPETVDALVNSIATLSREQERPFATVFHGGEPLLLGRRKLENLLAKLRDRLPPQYQICMQTNGMLITDEILDLCQLYRTTISVSLDGPKPINDKFRIGKHGESTFLKVTEGIRKLRAHRDSDFLFSGILTVIDPTSNPDETYQFLKGLGAPCLDFLFRDGNHSTLPFGKASFESAEYGQWLCELLDVYLSDQRPVRIRILDDLMRLSLGGKGIKEGAGLTDFGIAIIETDGSINKNDTLKSAFSGADRFSTRWSIYSDSLASIFASDEFRAYHEVQRPSSAACRACDKLSVCGGGMPLHRWRDGSGFDNPSVYCNDQKLVINRIAAMLVEHRLTA
jgi:uncharacterized protein